MNPSIKVYCLLLIPLFLLSTKPNYTKAIYLDEKTSL